MAFQCGAGVGGAQPRLSCGHTHGAGSFRQPHAAGTKVPGDEDRGKRENIYPDQAVLRAYLFQWGDVIINVWVVSEFSHEYVTLDSGIKFRAACR